MTIEKINNVQPIQTIQNTERQTEEEPVVQQPAGNTKEIVTVLSVLSAIGAAGVAIYKHKNAKKMIEQAEMEAKKKVDEAEEKVKQAAEETEKKIKEAVDKVRNEYEKTKEKADDLPKSVNPQKTSESNMTKTSKSQNQRTEKKPKTKILEGGISDDTLKVIDPNVEKQVSESQNGIIVIPRFTKLAEFYKKITSSIKNKFKQAAKEKKTVTGRDYVKEYKSILKDFGKKASKTTTETKNYIVNKWINFISLFKRKKAEIPVMEISEEGKKIRQDIKNQLSGKTDYEKLANDLISKPRSQAEHDKLQALYNLLVAEEPKASELFKGIKLPDVTKTVEKDLVTEYKALEKFAKDLPVSDLTAQRFLEIKGELLNHRGYKIDKNGILIKPVPKEKIKFPPENTVKESSDLDLLVEYYYLKNKVQNLPVMSKESQKFLEIKGELLNHRGYKVKPDGKLTKTKSLSLKDKIKRFFNL